MSLGEEKCDGSGVGWKWDGGLVGARGSWTQNSEPRGGNVVGPKDFDSIEEYKDELKAQEDGKKARKWGWESLIYDLCEGDFTKIKAVGELPLILVFNMLAMRKELGLLETPKL